jgi:peptidoglycan/LPS O-acetylase OafA/YrhL
MPRLSGPSLAELADRGRDNNCDILRFGAATAVVFAHAFLVAEGSCDREPLSILSRGQTNLGGASVALFFILSGFLITKSYDTAPNAVAFLARRALRILPALLVVVALTVLVLGPLVTTLPLAEYFSRFETYRYFVRFTSVQLGLPGVFESNPAAGVVNTSLWTLRHEGFVYLEVLLLGTLGLLGRRIAFGLLGASLFAHAALTSFPALAARDPHWFWLNLSAFHSYFWAGAFYYLSRKTLVMSRGLAAAAAFAVAACVVGGPVQPVYAVCGGYLTIYAAYALWLPGRKFTRQGDFSYGLYVFGYPLQQLVTQELGGTWWQVFLVSYPLTLACAYASWHLVERPALRLKRLIGSSAGAPAPLHG